VFSAVRCRKSSLTEMLHSVTRLFIRRCYPTENE